MSVKEAPARGLRAVLARFRSKGGAAPAKAQAATPAAEASNGHVKVVVPQAVKPETVVAETATPQIATHEPETVVAETATPETSEPETVVAETATPETSAALPLANYDTLTVASLRARLRNLDTAQLEVLIDYEKAHQGRAEVIGMFERRVAKIAAGLTTGFPAIS